MSERRKSNPSLVDTENPEWTEKDFARAKPASEGLSKLFGAAAAEEMLPRRRGQSHLTFWSKTGGRPRFRRPAHTDFSHRLPWPMSRPMLRILVTHRGRHSADRTPRQTVP